MTWFISTCLWYEYSRPIPPYFGPRKYRAIVAFEDTPAHRFSPIGLWCLSPGVHVVAARLHPPQICHLTQKPCPAWAALVGLWHVHFGAAAVAAGFCQLGTVDVAKELCLIGLLVVALWVDQIRVDTFATGCSSAGSCAIFAWIRMVRLCTLGIWHGVAWFFSVAD